MKSLYVTDAEAAVMLGRSTAWIKKNAEALETQYGFPKVDPAIGKRHRPSIEQWAKERNSRSQIIQQPTAATIGNPDEF